MNLTIKLKIALPHPFLLKIPPNNRGTKKLYNSKIITVFPK